MLGVRDDAMALAAKKLADAGFARQNWSFSSTVDPATQKENKMYEGEGVRGNIALAYANFDAKTIRFQCLDSKKYTQCTVLIPWSYIRLSIPPGSAYTALYGSSSQPAFYAEGNLHYPNVVLLLQSIIMVYLEEKEVSKRGDLRVKLAAWAIGYLYGELSLRDDVLDACEHEGVREYFNREIQRGSGVPRIREKWGRPRELITNERIKEFQ